MPHLCVETSWYGDKLREISSGGLLCYDGFMLVDLIDFARLPGGESGARQRAFGAVIDLLRRKLGVSIGYDARRFPFGDFRLVDAVRIGEKLREKKIIRGFAPVDVTLSDEPTFYWWSALCDTPNGQPVSGASFESSEKALLATLAEGLERYIWLTQSDYFVGLVRASEAQIEKKGPVIGVREWVGFSDEQRSLSAKRTLKADAQYEWIQAHSLVSNKRCYIPAQIVSPLRTMDAGIEPEPVIRQLHTTGLATWPTQSGARLAGALEVIEREAYMIMWLNQLSLPRIDIEYLKKTDPLLERAFTQCARYRLKAHVVRLLTDAPTHAICVVLEDESAVAPRFAIGLNAHRSLTRAVLKALTEALRARGGYRMNFIKDLAWRPEMPVIEIGHRDRLLYWGEHPENLEFMIRGTVEVPEQRAWERDSESGHLARLVAWCQEERLECVSVSLGISKTNPTNLHIEMVAMPELQPTYLHEEERAFGGTRWRTIPEKFGYRALAQPFSERPHPFS